MADLKVRKASGNLSTTWKQERSHVGAFSGGKVQRFSDMERLACQFDDTVKVLHVPSGQVVLDLKQLDPAMVADLAAEAFTCFAVHPNGTELVTASKNGLLRHWNLAERRCVRAWKSAHSSPVLSMDYDSTGTLVATGGSDKTVQVWDVEKGFATHHFRGHTGTVHAVHFHPDPRHLLLFSLSDDCTVRVWDLHRHKCAATLEQHLSPATCVAFSPDGQTLVTGGRDGVMVFYALNGEGGGGAFRVLKTVPVYEILEGMCVLPHFRPSVAGDGGAQNKNTAKRRLAKSFCFATAGRSGAVKVWRYGLDTPGAAAGSGKKKKKAKAVPAVAGKLTCELLLTEGPANGRSAAAAGGGGGGGGGAGVGAAVAPTATSALQRRRQQEEDEESQRPAKKRGKKNRKKARGTLEDAGHGTAEKEGYSGVLLIEPHTLVAVTHDHNFHFLDASSARLRQTRQVMGFNDEILDLKYIPDSLYEQEKKAAAAAAHPHNQQLAQASSTAAPPSRRRRRRVAMATNSEHVRLVDLANFDTALLSGHTAMVLALAVSPGGALLATTAQDATCRVWSVGGRGRAWCVGVCRGHTAAVGAVCFPNRAATALRPTGPAFLATASADMSVKLWDLRPVLQLLQQRARAWQLTQRRDRKKKRSSKRARPAGEGGGGDGSSDGGGSSSDASDASDADSGSDDGEDAYADEDDIFPEPLELSVLCSVAAHKKDINAVAMAPNDQLLASASQDKRVALWRVHCRSGDDVVLEEAARLTGHRRGVWCAQFSPVDRVVATGSADRTIKVWSVTTHECLQTLEGHSSSVLKLSFLRGGVQLLSAGADGLLKLWTLRSNECVSTVDAHDDKIWALEPLPADDDDDGDVRGDDAGGDADGGGQGDEVARRTRLPRMITGASDSALKIWYDATAEVEDESIAAREEFVLREQEMLNAYRAGRYARAMTIALEIDQPLRLRGLLELLVEEDTLAEHAGQVEFTPQTLTRLLLYVRDWNTNSRHCEVAQAVLSFVLTAFTFEDIRRAVKEAGAAAVSKGNAGTRTGGAGASGSGVGGDADGGTPPVALHELVAGLIAYSERHLKRAARVFQSSFLVEYTLLSMQTLLPQQGLPVDGGDREEDLQAQEAQARAAFAACGGGMARAIAGNKADGATAADALDGEAGGNDDSDDDDDAGGDGGAVAADDSSSSNDDDDDDDSDQASAAAAAKAAAAKAAAEAKAATEAKAAAANAPESQTKRKRPRRRQKKK